jgi:hypothetical protein
MALMGSKVPDIQTDMARIKRAREPLQHRLTLIMTLVVLVLGGVLSTLWVLAHPEEKTMDDHALDDRVRRLTARVVKMDDRDTTMAARLERDDAMLEAQHTMH